MIRVLFVYTDAMPLILFSLDEMEIRYFYVLHAEKNFGQSNEKCYMIRSIFTKRSFFIDLHYHHWIDSRFRRKNLLLIGNHVEKLYVYRLSLSECSKCAIFETIRSLVMRVTSSIRKKMQSSYTFHFAVVQCLIIHFGNTLTN